MMVFMRRIYAVSLFSLAIVLVGPLLGGNVGWEGTESSIDNGFYLVTWRGINKDDAPPPGHDEYLLEYKYQFLDPTSDRPHEYVVVNAQQRVPIELSEDPTSVPLDDGRIHLELSLTPEAGKTLENLTHGNVGRKIAIVIGSEVVTTHTIREAIKGGKVRISRCGDDACRYILAKLKE